MKLTLRMTRRTGRFIKTLPPKQYKQVVSTIFSSLNNPQSQDSRRLRGSPQNNRCVDMGEYRIIYRVEGEELLVLAGGNTSQNPKVDDTPHKRELGALRGLMTIHGDIVHSDFADEWEMNK